MAARITTYEKIKELLVAKMDVLFEKIEANKQISMVKFRELKADTEEIKNHAKETNGNVYRNVEKIHQLEIDQNEDNKFRKRSWYFIVAVALIIVTNVLTKIFI